MASSGVATTAQPSFLYNVPPTTVDLSHLHPDFAQRVMGAMHAMMTRPWKHDDILIDTFPRTGTHLVWTIVRMLLQGSTAPIQDPLEISHIEMPGFQESAQKGRRVLTSHQKPCILPAGFDKDGRKIIHVTRNPKDALISSYHFVKDLPLLFAPIESWDKFFDDFLHETCHIGDWFSYMRAWEEYQEAYPNSPILHVRYEDILLDPRPHITRLAAFIQVDASESLLDSIIQACSFDQMKNTKIASNLLSLSTDGAPKIFRTGKIGQWKDVFTVAENEKFDQIYFKRMEGSQRQFIFERL